MGNLHQIGELQIGQDMPHQRRVWKFERIGWGFMVVILLSALAGLLGPGPLSKRVASTSLFEVEFNRFERNHSPAQLKLHFLDTAAGGSNLTVTLSKTYLERIKVERIDPEPESTEIAGEEIDFRFAVRPALPGTIQFHFRPNSAGRLEGRLSIRETSVELKQFVYP